MNSYPFKKCEVNDKHEFMQGPLDRINSSTVRLDDDSTKLILQYPMICKWCLHIQWTEFF